MMNNKGQTLVLFVILIPILFVIISLMVDTGMLSFEKKKISNTITDIIKNNNINNIGLILNKNNIDIINIRNDNDIIYLSVSKEYNGIFKKYDIILKYKIYYENNKLIVKE